MKKSIHCFVLLSLALVAPLPFAPAHAATAKTYNHDLDAALDAAIVAGKIDQVRDLLQRGADPNAKTPDGAGTPLLCVAALDGKTADITRSLVQAGADIEAVTAQGDTALSVASLAGNLDVVNALLKAGAKVEGHAESGMTPLVCAAAAGQTEVARALLKAGANVNARTIEGGSPVIYGSAKTNGGTGNLATVKLLVEAGADIGATTADGKSALDVAHASGLNEIGQYLETTKARDEALLRAVLVGDWNGIKAAVAAGANPRYQTTFYLDENDTEGTVTTAAMRLKGDAAGFDAATAAQILAHSDLEAHGKDGDTALALAVLRRDLVMVRLLLKAGANPNVVSVDTGETPLMVAAEFGTLPMVQALVAGGAKTDAKSNDGKTALAFARHTNNVEVAKYLQAQAPA